MSGICGVIASERAARIEERTVAGMLRALDVAGVGGGETVARGPAAMAVLGFARAPGSLASRHVGDAAVVVAVQGVLYEDGTNSPPGGAHLAQRLLDRYLETGIGLVERLEGDIALAVWDGRTGRAYLAVDRFRVQPLYYLATPDRLVFGSRMASVLAAPSLQELHVSPACVLDVLSSSMIPTPRTVFREVAKLPPASIVEYADGRASVRRYWDLSFRSPRRESFRELARETQARLQQSIRSRVTVDGADGRIGAFLSGGIDSSAVVGELTRLTGGPVKTFSIGFAEQSFNEIEYARITARAFGADHHEYFVTPGDTVRALEVLSRNFDEPYANSSSVPVYYCSRLASEHGVDVLYAGDAGDELFAGNPWYATQRLFEYWYRIPAWLREPVVRPLVNAGARTLGLGVLEKGRKYIQRASIPLPERLTSYGFFSDVPVGSFFEPAFLREVGEDYDPNAALYALYREALADDELDKRLYIDLKLIISDNDVLKVVRMTHAAGIAVRFPFLDHRVAEFAASVPARKKMKGLQLRSFFKRAYSDLLPPEVIAKKKHGFGLPIPVWLRTDPELNGIMRELVLGKTTLERGIYRREALESLVERHKTDSTSFYGTSLWHLMMIESWMRKYDRLRA